MYFFYWYFLILFITVTNFIQNASGLFCPINEEYVECVITCNDCFTKGQCEQFTCNPGCDCIYGYFRNSQGICVPDEECDAYAEPLPIPLPEPSCPPNEEYLQCASPCDDCRIRGKCQYFACQGGCNCVPGFYRNNMGICIPESQCPRRPPYKPPTYQCPRDQMYYECVPTCKNTCANYYSDEYCSDDYYCQSGCFCKEGLVKDANGYCVDPKYCPKPKCGYYEEYKRCVVPCNTCSQKGNCDYFFCQPGCDCQAGYYRDDNNRCILESQCPKTSTYNYTCTGNEFYTDCVSRCNTCKDRGACVFYNCKPGCDCMPGYFRNNMGKCVLEAECGKDTYDYKDKKDGYGYKDKKDGYQIKEKKDGYDYKDKKDVHKVKEKKDEYGYKEKKDVYKEKKDVYEYKEKKDVYKEEKDVYKVKEYKKKDKKKKVKKYKKKDKKYKKKDKEYKKKDKKKKDKKKKDKKKKDKKKKDKKKKDKKKKDKKKKDKKKKDKKKKDKKKYKKETDLYPKKAGYDDKCGPDEEYYECMPMCKTSCATYHSDDRCIGSDICKPGCFCKRNLVKHEEKCIEPDQCPYCRSDEQFYTCKPDCKNTCLNYNRPDAVCPLVCQPGCFCKPGYVKTLLGKCVLPSECSDKPPVFYQPPILGRSRNRQDDDDEDNLNSTTIEPTSITTEAPTIVVRSHNKHHPVGSSLDTTTIEAALDENKNDSIVTTAAESDSEKTSAQTTIAPTETPEPSTGVSETITESNSLNDPTTAEESTVFAKTEENIKLEKTKTPIPLKVTPSRLTPGAKSTPPTSKKKPLLGRRRRSPLPERITHMTLGMSKDDVGDLSITTPMPSEATTDESATDLTKTTE